MTSPATSFLFGFLNSCLAVCCFGFVHSASGNEFYSLSLGLGEESNVPRGLDGFHELGSVFSEVGLTAGKLIQLGFNDSLLLSASAGYSRFGELRGFDQAEVGVGLSYRHKFGFGPTAPSVNVASSYSLARSQGAARDTNIGVIEVSLSKQFESGFSLSGGLDYQRNTSKLLPEDPLVSAFGYDPVRRAAYELFDFESASAFINGDYTFYNGWLASAGFRKINGATVASTTTPSLAVYKISDAFYTDPAFNSEMAARPWFAYQLETNASQYSAALSIPILQDTSLDVTASWIEISAPSGRDYDNTVYAVSLIHNF
jgi:hypothetical protein